MNPSTCLPETASAVPDAPVTKKLDFYALAPVIAAILSILIILPVMKAFIITEVQTDFREHIRIAAKFEETGKLPDLHFLYHVITATTQRLTGLTIVDAGLLVGIACFVITAAIIFLQVAPRANYANSPWRIAFAILTTLMLLVVGPAQNPWNFELRGMFTPNIYHNPTFLLVRPFGLVLLALTVTTFATRGSLGLRLALATGVLGALSVTAKPNFAMCWLPAVACLVMLDRHDRIRIDAWKCAALIAIPSVAMLAWQVLQYNDPAAKNVIRFMPFFFIRDSVGLTVLKQTECILFPIVMLIGFRSAIWKDTGVRLAWLIWLAGWCWAELFVEDGPRLTHGNFFWGINVATSCLLVWNMKFLMNKPAGIGYRAATIAGWTAFALHVAGGFSVWYTMATY